MPCAERNRPPAQPLVRGISDGIREGDVVGKLFSSLTNPTAVFDGPAAAAAAAAASAATAATAMP